jgi:uncharacterized protein (DUF488 family)
MLFFTIGHSTRSIEGSASLLRPLEITLVVDVRAIPQSRTNPQFNASEFADVLPKYQIRYEHIATLGGLRSKKSNVPANVKSFGGIRSFIIMLITPRAKSFEWEWLRSVI